MAKTPNPVDIHVGARVRQARMMLAMSQEKLGNALGLTFQQVQKYENGTNRIVSSRLAQISLAVRQPIPWFYEGAGTVFGNAHDLAAPLNPCQQLGTTREGIALARAFTRIHDPKMRHSIVALVEHIVGDDASEREAA